MGHIGLTPQSINTLGSFRAQGREEANWAPIENDARAIADAGAFSVVIEAVAEPLARKINPKHFNPHHRDRRQRGLRRAGSRAGRHAGGCRRRRRNSFASYGNLGPAIEAAVEAYATDVRSRAFRRRSMSMR